MSHAIARLRIRALGLAIRLAPAPSPFMFTGPGAALLLARSIADRGARRVLVVTDAMLVKLGVIAPVLHALEQAGVGTAVFQDVEPDPSIAIVLAAALAFLPGTIGRAKSKTPFRGVLSNSSGINRLSLARMCLFAARDVWFVVSVPLFLATDAPALAAPDARATWAVVPYWRKLNIASTDSTVAATPSAASWERPR